jgi:hypothetical protein
MSYNANLLTLKNVRGDFEPGGFRMAANMVTFIQRSSVMEYISEFHPWLETRSCYPSASLPVAISISEC